MAEENIEINNLSDLSKLNENEDVSTIVREPKKGRTMEVFTTEPGVQFYAGLSLSADAPEVGKSGVIHTPKTGFCLETQDYADSVNFPEMGGAILRPDEPFSSTTLYRFSAK